MQLIQFLAAWLFPGGAQCFTVDMATADSSELDRTSSSSPSSSSVNAAGAGSGSSLSSPSSTTSSSDNGHRGFFKSRSRQESASTTPLCFGAGAGGGGTRRLLRGSRVRAPAKQPPQEAAATMAPKVKGDVVGRYLRKISRRLKKARSNGKGSPSPMAAAAVDDTARERAESVARAISYCKETLKRGTSPSPSRSRSRSRSPPPPPPSPSLDEWLHDRQDEIIASAAEQHCDEQCSDPRPSPTRPRRAAGWPLGMQTTAKRFKESPGPCSASPCRDGSLAACDVAHGEESPQPRHGHGCRGESSMSSLDEMEFLKTFDGDEEMINDHFITVEI